MPDESRIVEETDIGDGLTRWAVADVAKPRHLTEPEKWALEAVTLERTQKAEHRQVLCWWCQKNKAAQWVHHVGFDLKDDDAVLGHHAIITSDDYPGPVPGFCSSCADEGPRRLAQVVYFDTPAVHFGVRARRWYVQLTDGSQKGGLITVHPAAPTVA